MNQPPHELSGAAALPQIMNGGVARRHHPGLRQEQASNLHNGLWPLLYHTM
jgi:hypothetical protein